MTVALALAAIGAQLATIASPQTLKKIYADPREAVSLGEFPCAVMALAPGVVHVWGTEAAGGGSGLAEHDYTVAIWVFTGARETPIGELHSRTLPWAEAVFRSLVANIRLSGAVIQMGDGQSTDFLTYQIGPLDWGNQQLWGIKILLPVIEKPTVAMN